MLIKQADKIKGSEITPERIYRQRRSFMKGVAAAAGASALSPAALAALGPYDMKEGLPTYGRPAWLKAQIDASSRNLALSADDKLTPYFHAITYNNFYEFGLDKNDPARYAQEFRTDPWTLEIKGLVDKPLTLGLEDLIKPMMLEERIYRLRCVEGWSMVIPWVGFSLGDLLKRAGVKTEAKYVAFRTLEDPEQMRGQSGWFGTLDWPYREGVRIDEAMNPLAFLAVGVYGTTLPPQNGAPIRLVLPWKYGFKSIKSIVSIELTDKMPDTSWNLSAPQEYGFYANVNPKVDHPRWTQATERRLPSTLLSTNIIETEMFNGYGEEVAHLYKDMDLSKWY